VAGAATSSLFWRSFFSNLFNPKSILFFVSVVPGFIGYEPSASSLLVQAGRLGAIYIGIASTIHTGIVLLASQLRPLLITGSRQRSVRRILSLALVLVAAWLAWSTRQA
jgi:threonine/homoserine/homoserine lactone efflux protein